MNRILLGMLSLALAGCGGGKPAEESHEEAREGATYAEGKGITLMDETSKAIDLKLVEAEERKLAPIVRIEAQVYRGANEAARPGAERAGSAYAAAYVSSAKGMKPGDSATLTAPGREFPATVWRIDDSSEGALAKVEAILEIPDAGNSLKVGDFVTGEVRESVAGSEVISVPRSAVLEASAGKFVFVQNGGFLLRTPITTGAESAEHVEITDGLYAGDVVASQPVETLYLIELRATKGGGHCH